MYKRHQQYTNSWIDPTHFTRVSIFRAIQYERERIMIAATRKQIEQDKFITISEGICWDLSFWVIPFIQLAQDRLKIWLSSSNQPSLSHVPLWTVLETPLSGPWTKMQRTTHVATLRYSYSALHRPHYAKKKNIKYVFRWHYSLHPCDSDGDISIFHPFSHVWCGWESLIVAAWPPPLFTGKYWKIDETTSRVHQAMQKPLSCRGFMTSFSKRWMSRFTSRRWYRNFHRNLLRKGSNQVFK